jgi:hypothetical protein
VLGLAGNARLVIQRIIKILFDLISPLFLKRLVQKANAKPEAALKKKFTLDMVAHGTIEGLVQSIL